MKSYHVLTIAVLASLVSYSLDAAPPRDLLEKLRDSKADTRPRRANDQIEGAIWEYKGTLKKDADAKKEKSSGLSGRFRIEGAAIFDVSQRVSTPSGGKLKKLVESAREGDSQELKVPAEPQQKRIGEYRKLDNGKLRFDFNDEESLHGVMIIWKKKETTNVWMGTYKEIEDKEIVDEWVVELRILED